jgi:hypothetical protein
MSRVRKLFLASLTLSVLVAALLAMPFVNYRRTAGLVPPWVRLGGLTISGETEAQVAAAFQRALEEPVAAYYGEERVLLRPAAVNFQVDVKRMIDEATGYNLPDLLLRYLVEKSLGRPITYTDVPLRYTMDEASLDAWLADMAARHDRKPGMPQPIMESLTLAPGKPGTKMDVAASRERVVAALGQLGERKAELVVEESPAPPMDVNALAGLLQARLDQFPGIASAYLYFLPTGEEIAINADIAYAGTSTLKIPILEQVYRKLDLPPTVETSKIISETMMHSGNFTANLMLGIVGDGDWDRGVQEMNKAFKALGMTNTFMAAPYDRKFAVDPHIVTDANSRKDVTTYPDPYMQTTPRDIGSALVMLVECANGGGTLIAAYGDKITPAECQQALDFMSLNEMKEMLVGGLPAGVKAVHKHGYVPDTHGDVAAVWTPAGPFVLSVFLYRPTWLEWAYSNPTFQDMARASYNFFANQYTGPAQPPASEDGTAPQ